MRAKAFNSQIFLEILCYSVFGGLMFYLVRSGNYLSYVTPRMKPYLYFAAIIMIIWACAGLGRLLRPQYKVRSAHCFILALPALLLILPHTSLSVSDISGNFIGGQSSFGPAAAQKPSSTSGTDFSSVDSDPADDLSETPVESPNNYSDDNGNSQPDESASSELPGLDTKNMKITVSNDDFGLWFSEIYTNMEKYTGYTIVMTGYVFKDSELFEENEFAPARLMMSCCVADLSPAGLTCIYDKASELKADSWVTVEGTLQIGQYEYEGEKYDEPQIVVEKITPAEEAEGYVYPYF